MTDEGTRGGARARRRGLYGPPPRLTRTSPLVGRLLWHIGDWGRASEHIGGRWEAVASALAADHVGPHHHLVVLAHTPALMAEVFSSGLPHADALNTWREDDHLMIEPLDFKWSLETASARQVSEDTLERLLALELPFLTTALHAARAEVGLPETAEIKPRDGRFVAPEHPANRTALRAEPDLASVLLPVEPGMFFEPLPGWPAATVLARWEGADLGRVRGIDAVERYYRLGAGVSGALVRLHTGLFDAEPPVVDPPALLADLRARGVARTLNLLLLHIERRLIERKALDEKLAQLPRNAYTFGRMRADLTRAGVPRTVLDSRGALGRAYGEVMREVSNAVRLAGEQLVNTGQTPEAALEQLSTTPERWAALGSAAALALSARLR